MIYRGIELVYPGNAGLDEIVEAERVIAWNYDITWGDLWVPTSLPPNSPFDK